MNLDKSHSWSGYPLPHSCSRESRTQFHALQHTIFPNSHISSCGGGCTLCAPFNPLSRIPNTCQQQCPCPNRQAQAPKQTAHKQTTTKFLLGTTRPALRQTCCCSMSQKLESTGQKRLSRCRAALAWDSPVDTLRGPASMLQAMSLSLLLSLITPRCCPDSPPPTPVPPWCTLPFSLS